MIYYGERSRTVDAVEVLAQIRAGAARAAGLPPGLARHELLTALLLEAGELGQGLGDLAFEAHGEDGQDPASSAALSLCLALARPWAASWQQGFAVTPLDLTEPLAALEVRLPPAPLTLRTPEGYAHYAVYPEAYAEAARALAGAGPVRVIGIRSIGTSLAAVVAAVLGVRGVLTVRPVGPPFERTLALAAELREALRTRAGEQFAVVDEGPGLSGSSFAAVAETLEAAGAPPERVHLFPGHGGEPGPSAPPAVRARWPRWPRHHVPFEAVVLGPAGLPTWVADAMGRSDGPPLDVSAGAWRARALGPAQGWPPVFRQQERRKYLLEAGGESFLAEFVGLGRSGEVRHARARDLADAGYGPPVLGLRHGFLLRRWLQSLLLCEVGVARPGLVAQVAAYLAFRARRFGARRGEGATPQELLAMLRQNAAEALGPDLALETDRFVPAVREATASARPVAVDAKLEPWEWLVLPDGRLVKADGVQHADGHDLVGAQDIAWDVAGARVELGLDDAAAEELAGRVRRDAGAPLEPAVLAFTEAAYLAHRLARWSFAHATEGDQEERARIGAARDRYADLLAQRLAGRGQPA